MSNDDKMNCHQEPVAFMYTRQEVEWPLFYEKRQLSHGWKESPLYTHADPAEVEQLKKDVTEDALRHSDMCERLAEALDLVVDIKEFEETAQDSFHYMGLVITRIKRFEQQEPKENS